MKRVLILAALLLASPAFAQPISAEIQANMLQSCLAANPGNRTQRTYCDCSVKLTAERLTLPALTAEEDAIIARTRQGVAPHTAAAERPVFRAIMSECWARAGVVTR
jgi:hypothetical protein